MQDACRLSDTTGLHTTYYTPAISQIESIPIILKIQEIIDWRNSDDYDPVRWNIFLDLFDALVDVAADCLARQLPSEKG